MPRHGTIMRGLGVLTETHITVIIVHRGTCRARTSPHVVRNALTIAGGDAL